MNLHLLPHLSHSYTCLSTLIPTTSSSRFSFSFSHSFKKKTTTRCPYQLHHLPFFFKSSKSKRGFACQATADTESESNADKNNNELATPESSDLLDSLQRIDSILSAPDSIQNKDEPATIESSLKVSLERINSILGAPDSIENKDECATTESSDLQESNERTDGGVSPPDSALEKDEEMEVTSGSPLPGMKQVGEPIMIPKATIDILKNQVFGFDTFYVTSHEPYEQGVLFKGNLRGKAATSYEKITKRMQDIFGDQYRLFLLINPEDDEPVAVVVPKQTLQPESTAVPEWFAASAFGLVTIFTLLLRNVPALQFNFLSTLDNIELLKDGLPGALVSALVLGIHEIGHVLVARNIGAKLGVPYFVPSWQIGSFGAITRILTIVSKREDLLKFAAAGPFAGFFLGLLFLLVGFILPPIDGIGIVVDSSVFHESFLVGGIAKLLLGEALREGTSLSVNPLVIWAWAGLLINAINSIPAGELDGGRIAFALWGRKASARLSSAAIALLGISSLFNDVAFYWVVLIFFLQRGPISPLAEEITEPDSKYVGLGIAILLLGLLICLPYPFPFVSQGASFDF